MELDFLDKYEVNGIFTFKSNESLEEKCNAPNDKAGIYLIYKVIENTVTLLYIGSSGRRKKDGTLHIRKSKLGGMKDRIVNGYQPKFGKIKRSKVFPEEMLKQNISELIIKWWVTFDSINNFDFPTDIEKKLTDDFKSRFQKLPEWHK